MPTPLESMRIVARRLEPLNVPFAFVGGAVVCVLSQMLRSPDFLDALPGHLSGLSGARQRTPLVLERFKAIAVLKRAVP